MYLAINPINNFLLPPVLFIALFSFVSCLMTDYTRQTSTQTHEQKPETELLPNPQKAKIVTFETKQKQEIAQDLNSQNKSIFTSSIEPQILEIIAHLTKRECRSLCSPITRGGLGIPMKQNGVEKTTEMMRSAISKAFKTEPDRVFVVIRERLPEKTYSIISKTLLSSICS
jgi:hypothetical protein